MTAMSAPRSAASNADRPTVAEPVPPNDAAPDGPVEIRLPGTAWTYAARELLKAIGLRWDPATHAWHGTATASERAKLVSVGAPREVRVAPLESFADPASEEGSPSVPPQPPAAPDPPRRPPPNFPAGALRRDYSRSRAESRTFHRFAGEEKDEAYADVDSEDPSTTRRFTAWETTRGLPDDDRVEDERRAARALRDLRARVKAARALVARTPGLGAVLSSDPARAARFYAGFRITEQLLVAGACEADPPDASA